MGSPSMNTFPTLSKGSEILFLLLLFIVEAWKKAVFASLSMSQLILDLAFQKTSSYLSSAS